MAKTDAFQIRLGGDPGVIGRATVVACLRQSSRALLSIFIPSVPLINPLCGRRDLSKLFAEQLIPKAGLSSEITP